jgi:hypothetical protein
MIFICLALLLASKSKVCAQTVSISGTLVTFGDTLDAPIFVPDGWNSLDSLRNFGSLKGVSGLVTPLMRDSLRRFWKPFGNWLYVRGSMVVSSSFWNSLLTQQDFIRPMHTPFWAKKQRQWILKSVTIHQFFEKRVFEVFA